GPGPLASRERQAIRGVVCEERATKPAGLRAFVIPAAFRFSQPADPKHTARVIALLECGDLSDLSPLWPGRQNESGDKSPHSISGSLFVRLLRLSRAETDSYF